MTRSERYEQFVRDIARWLPGWVRWVTVDYSGDCWIWTSIPKKNGLLWHVGSISALNGYLGVKSPAVESPTFTTLRRIHGAGTEKVRVERV